MKGRRAFLRGGLALGLSLAGLAGLGGLGGPGGLGGLGGLLPRPAQAAGPVEGRAAGRWGLVVFSKLLGPVELRRIIAACHQAHSVPECDSPQAVRWIWSAPYAEAFPGATPKYAGRATLQRRFPLLCNHCGNAACVRVCPSGATFRRPDGIVGQDHSRCIGCRACMAACPYGARSFNFVEPAPAAERIAPDYPPRPRGVVEKCNFCLERLEAGLSPHCVEAARGAFEFGDLADPDSTVSRALRGNLSLTRNPGLGLNPAVYYIL